ncbi:TetR/AcrR family transcriptional regulator [Janthinobacterium agaricidamnosum]|nr:TetR/AcrR family transcriptional regulator [Janthinobacterium agaricidamnosum]
MNVTDKKHPCLKRAQDRRKQVLDAAASCFSRSGFHGASMAEISKAAGMSAGHIYNYFDSKDAIIAAFVEQNVERISMIMQDLAQQDDPLQAMIDNIEVHVAENLDPTIWSLPLEIFSEASRNPRVAERVQDADRRSRGMLHKIIRDARIRRGLPTDEEMLAGRVETVIAMYQGLHIRVLHNPDQHAASLSAAFRVAMAALILGQ